MEQRTLLSNGRYQIGKLANAQHRTGFTTGGGCPCTLGVCVRREFLVPNSVMPGDDFTNPRGATLLIGEPGLLLSVISYACAAFPEAPLGGPVMQGVLLCSC